MNNHVLLIEDDRSIAEFFRMVLTLAGLEVEVVHTAREGLIKLSTHTPNLVLLDMNLGAELGGEDILYQIRSNPRFDNTYVIIVTGYPDRTYPVDELADMILIKPIDIEQLTTLARRLLSYDIAPRFLSFRDPVTTLFTLEFFQTRLDLAFERSRRRPEFCYGVAALCVEIQDETGQKVTPDLDTALHLRSEIAHRIRRNVRPTDTVSSADDWCFLVLSEDLAHSEDIKIIVDRLVKALSGSILVNKQTFGMKVSCGYAVRRDSFCKAEDILEEAERQLVMVDEG